MNERIWRRRGSEAEADDRSRGRAAPICHEDLENALAGYFEADLADLSEQDRADAVTALVRGYLEGG